MMLLSGVVLISACSQRVSVESISHDPEKFTGKEITVAGRVANLFAEDDNSAFELDDGTGRLWVVRENTNVPAHNSSVKVRGTIEQGLPFAGRRFVIALRESRTK